MSTARSVGIVGALGDMGRLYVNRLARHTADTDIVLHVCDLPENYDRLLATFHDGITAGRIHAWRDGFDVVRRADFILYSVETERIAAVVARFGPATKVGAIVGGQTSVKDPEIRAFEQHLPADVDIVTCHSLHGPRVDPRGQPLVVIRHRCRNDDSFAWVVALLRGALDSDIVQLSAVQHDQITADTQAVTHLAFLSMGSAWKSRGVFPWLATPDKSGSGGGAAYTGGIENAKVMTTLRIYASKWHVYAGLAILNPSARQQVQQYAHSVSDLFQLMIQEREDEFRARVYQVRRSVFGVGLDDNTGGRQTSTTPTPTPSILLSDEWLDEFSLSSGPSPARRKPNSHLSLLAIADCWHQLQMNPYDHMICQTPPFRIWLGITEYLFRSDEMLEAAIQAACHDQSIRADDLAFVIATQTWTQTILLGSMDGYRQRFQETSAYFEGKLDEAKRVSDRMMQLVADKWRQRQEAVVDGS